MRFHLLSLGCPKNTVDSEGMGELLRRAGYRRAERPDEADFLIVNTCGFIDRAREESLTALRELAENKTADQYLIAAGCMAQRYGSEMAQMIGSLDGIIGTRRWREIVTLIDGLARDRIPGAPHILPQPAPQPPMSHPVARYCPGVASAYVKIAEGCNAPCSFCAIPQIKGPFLSKPTQDVVAEVRELASQGIQEIILIAQDTTAYGRDQGHQDALAVLINEILKGVPDLPWLRIMYAYPQHVTARLIETMALNAQICHYLDLPLQHGHPRVLRRMNRPHDLNRVQSVVARLRQAMPDIALRTSFIVGYPGETDEEFQTLLDFMKEVAFDRVGVFVYSREEGTTAAALTGQIPEEIKVRRYGEAMALQQKISLRKNRQFIGTELQVLIEGAGDGVSVGRSYRDAPEVDGVVIVDRELPLNEFAEVRITEALEYDLIGDAQP